MNKLLNYRYITTTILLLFVFLSSTYSKEPLIYKIDIKQEINSSSWIYLQSGINEAHKNEADYIILDMNTYGGLVIYADSIRTLLLNTEIPLLAYVNNNAASAGALIAIACDSIYMKKGGNIGAVTVVNQTGEKMPDKYQSYMRATIRSTAESHGKVVRNINGKDTLMWHRDPNIAQAMVDERVVVDGISRDDEVVTFTAEEAFKNHYSEGIVDNIDEIIKNHLALTDYQLTEYKPGTIDIMKGWLTSPSFRAILIMIIVLGIYYEIQTPGVGFPILASTIAAIIYFAPLYIEGLAQNWEIALFILGLMLILAEIFIIPGFGIAGVSGGILVISMLILAMINNNYFDFEFVPSAIISESIITVVKGIILSILTFILLLRYWSSAKTSRRVALTKVMDSNDGYVGVSMKENDLIGKSGRSSTILRPVGKVVIDNENYDAVSCIGYIDKDTDIKVVRYENAQLYVIKNHDTEDKYIK